MHNLQPGGPAEFSLPALRRAGPIAPPAEPIAAERQAPHVRRQHGGDGVRADAENERELARPEDLVEQPDGAGEEEDGDDERLRERWGIAGRHAFRAAERRVAEWLSTARKRSIAGAEGIAYARAHA